MTETYRAISRRKLLALMGASAVTTLAVGCGSSDDPNSGAPNQAPDAQFRHGVASGEPLPEAVVIWTRVTPFAEAVPGSGLGGPVDVVWEVATDAGLALCCGKVVSLLVRHKITLFMLMLLACSLTPRIGIALRPVHARLQLAAPEPLQRLTRHQNRFDLAW